MQKRIFINILLLPLLFGLHPFKSWSTSDFNTYITADSVYAIGGYANSVHASEADFTFAISADMRNFTGDGGYNTSQYFRGAVEKIASLGDTAFMISPGDLDPAPSAYWTITQTLGTDYKWYPVVGNHELPGEGYEDHWGDNLLWLNNYDYGTVNTGPSGCPKTTYSFDYGNAHFVVLNEYCDSSGDNITDGDISDHLYNWLAADLGNTTQARIFVIGHEPAYPRPDMNNGKVRHLGSSLDKYPTNRDRFWQLLAEYNVVAYICGHTHSYSLAGINHVWQLDAGHARGLGDTETRSTFILVHVTDQSVTYQVYRDNSSGGTYALTYSGDLINWNEIYLPMIEAGN